jgi:catechol-2,3-dioxygenase
MTEIKVTKTRRIKKEVSMLGDKDAAANIAVKDLARASKFYADTLGLTPVDAEARS